MESAAVRQRRKKSVPAAQRVLAVLELLMASRKGLALSEIARGLGLPRSTTFYLINTIEECGYIYRTSPRGRYTFTAKLLELASRSLGCLGVREPAAPFLRTLMQKTGLTVHLGVIAQNEVVLIDKVAPAAGQQLGTWVGKRMPLHCTGLGKALMAYLPEEQIEHHIKQGLSRYNENTIVSAGRLKDELLRIQAHGYAIDDEEETVGLRCIGAPVFDKNNQAVAAISIAGTRSQLDDEKLERLVRAVKQAAAAVSAQLSGRA
ncbi:MAG TPA: IclR family transcriptional regulator [Candidatus Solibacter sp.]|nr:IclR family transcriptional regulator [Candidatus Solibacter sp.]